MRESTIKSAIEQWKDWTKMEHCKENDDLFTSKTKCINEGTFGMLCCLVVYDWKHKIDVIVDGSSLEAYEIAHKAVNKYIEFLEEHSLKGIFDIPGDLFFEFMGDYDFES